MTRPQAVLRFGAPLLALAVAASPASASPAQVHAKLEQARAPESQLSRSAVVSSQGVRFYRYRQEVGGLPVLASQVVVTDGRGAGADLLGDGSRRLGARQPALVRRAAAGPLSLRSVGRGAGPGPPPPGPPAGPPGPNRGGGGGRRGPRRLARGPAVGPAGANRVAGGRQGARGPGLGGPRRRPNGRRPADAEPAALCHGHGEPLRSQSHRYGRRPVAPARQRRRRR